MFSCLDGVSRLKGIETLEIGLYALRMVGDADLRSLQTYLTYRKGHGPKSAHVCRD